jgi:transcriptional regulator GlxA family with amidase domain
MSTPRRVVIVAFPRAQTLDFVGPIEVLNAAERLRPGSYERELVAPGGDAFATGSGVRIVPDRALEGVRGALDTLIVAGGSGVHEATATPATVAAVKRLSGRARRTASVCTGAFLLAEAGLLDGRRASTHWASAQRLADRYPAVTVDPDPIFIRDGDVWTSAGVTAGMDLTLALVEDDLGPDVAVAVARWLVLFAKRPGGQAQFSTPLSAQAAERRPLRAVQDHVRAHPEDDLSVETLAGRAHMSTRNFARAFRQEVGATPGAFVEAVRLERAKQLLESTGTPVDEVGRACGFGTPETLRRVFGRRLGVSPSDYRDRFRLAAAEAA